MFFFYHQVRSNQLTCRCLIKLIFTQSKDKKDAYQRLNSRSCGEGVYSSDHKPLCFGLKTANFWSRLQLIEERSNEEPLNIAIDFSKSIPAFNISINWSTNQRRSGGEQMWTIEIEGGLSKTLLEMSHSKCWCNPLIYNFTPKCCLKVKLVKMKCL